MSLPVRIDILQIHFGVLGKIFGVNVYPAVVARGGGDPGVHIHRHGHHEAVVIVGVLADQIYAAGSAIDPRILSVQFLELVLQEPGFLKHEIRSTHVTSCRRFREKSCESRLTPNSFNFS